MAVLSDYSVTKATDQLLDLKTEQWNLLSELKPTLHVLQVATTYLSSEYNESISAVLPIVHGVLKFMEATESDSPTFRKLKCAISQEINSRWQLNDLNPFNPSSILVAVCLDPRFKQTKFLDSHQHCLKTSTIEVVATTTSRTGSTLSTTMTSVLASSSLFHAQKYIVIL